MRKQLTPTPVVVAQKCSVCDEPWEAHPDDPGVEDCVALLRARIGVLEANQGNVAAPFPMPYPNVGPYPSIPSPPFTPTVRPTHLVPYNINEGGGIGMVTNLTSARGGVSWNESQRFPNGWFFGP